VYKKKNMIFYCKNRVDDWRHNLALGADIDENIESNIKTKLNNIVKKVNEIIPINFFSIDIAKIKNDFKVVEINSGVMMERYSTFNYQKAYNVYEKVIIDLFK
jgi:glutathione synthase/RimK-type ligase-like ATP-grasp enzyme